MLRCPAWRAAFARVARAGWQGLGCHKPGLLFANACLPLGPQRNTSEWAQGPLALAHAGQVCPITTVQEKGKVIDRSRGHHVLTAAHPSGLSASRGFFGCRHFSQANMLLQASGQLPIDW